MLNLPDFSLIRFLLRFCVEWYQLLQNKTHLLHVQTYWKKSKSYALLKPKYKGLFAITRRILLRSCWFWSHSISHVIPRRMLPILQNRKFWPRAISTFEHRSNIRRVMSNITLIFGFEKGITFWLFSIRLDMQ